MIRMTVGKDNPYLEELQYQLAKLGAGSMPRTAGAMASGASVIRDTWKGFALGGSLPGVTEPLKRPSRGYAISIRVHKNGPFDYEIYSEAKIAEMIENGTEQLDMKRTHPYGPRSRVSKKGIPYLVIPFRWGTPEGHDGKRVGFRNIMPEAVYNIVKNKKKFRQTKALMATHNEPNSRGIQVERRNYSGAYGKGGWGDRLTADMGDEVTPNMEGMSSMLGQDGKAAGYLTFRIISANSPKNSWIKPATPARHVTRAVAENTEEVISSMVEGAIMEDLG